MKNIFAHYFTWFARKDVSGIWKHWNWDGPGTCHNPERLINGIEDTASVDVPLIGAYDSSDARVHKYHLDLAKLAGIDAFCIDWYGYSDVQDKEHDNKVDKNFKLMINTATVHDVKLCICYEEKILFNEESDDDVIKRARNHMKYIASEYFPSTGYWHVEGRPVLIIWGCNRLSVKVWEQIFNEIENYNPWIIYSHHDHNPQYTEICQGFYPWVLIGNIDFQKKYLGEYYSTVNKYVEEGKSTSLGGGVWPGFNDSGVSGWGSGSRIIEDKEDELYDLTWNYVLENNPEWVSITTWNDWNEGSNIEPGIKQGAKYLKKTAEYVSRYKDIASECDMDLAFDMLNLLKSYQR